MPTPLLNIAIIYHHSHSSDRHRSEQSTEEAESGISWLHLASQDAGHSVETTEIETNGFTSFEIRHSVARPDDFLPISPDIRLCEDCRRELLDPKDRRYLYPFINCTNCGQRFTIIKDIPYDRPLTTMADFVMCQECAKEYADPLNRRFHAQPVACPKCGPEVSLVVGGQRVAANHEALVEVKRMLADGKIIAIKGLGGFHLACDATNDEVVGELRRRKGRVDNPFA